MSPETQGQEVIGEGIIPIDPIWPVGAVLIAIVVLSAFRFFRTMRRHWKHRQTERRWLVFIQQLRSTAGKAARDGIPVTDPGREHNKNNTGNCEWTQSVFQFMPGDAAGLVQWTQDGISIQAERIPINSEARWPWRRYGRLQRWLHKMQARGLNVSTLEYRLPVREHRSWKRSSRFELRPVTVCMLALSSFAREVEQTDQSRYLIFVSFDRIHSPILDTLRLLTEQSRQHQQHELPAHSAQESHAPASAHTSTAVGENLVLFQEYNQNASQAQSGYHERRRRRSDREYLRLVERFREKENNLIRITHDLRQPLTNLSLGFDRLETNMDRLQSIHGNSSSRDVAAVGDSVRRMRHQLNLLESMTHDILRVEVGQEITNEEDAYNVSALVVGIAEMYTDELERRRIVLEHNLKDDILSVKNRMAVYRIVHNLFSNAVKFCSTPGRIFVELQRHDGHFTVDIEDSGKGLHSPETFFELSRRNIGRSGSGWGIGLAAAHDMATALDGRLVARSPRHGNGARFFLVLPAVRV